VKNITAGAVGNALCNCLRCFRACFRCLNSVLCTGYDVFDNSFDCLGSALCYVHVLLRKIMHEIFSFAKNSAAIA
jgi:hypothetical protein